MKQILEFIHHTTYVDLPAEVRKQAQVCLLDLIGALVGGRQTKLSAIIRDHAALVFGGNQATLLLDGRRFALAGTRSGHRRRCF